MTGPLWLMLFLTAGLVWVVTWLVVEWRRDVTQAKAAGQAARDFLAETGRHSDLESDERTKPMVLEALTFLPVGEEPPRRSRRVPVQELLTRLRGEGAALRLNWQREDEQRAAQGTGGTDAGDFPTAVLPRIECADL